MAALGVYNVSTEKSSAYSYDAGYESDLELVSPSRVLRNKIEDVKMELLEGRLQLLETQRQMSAVLCQDFVNFLEDSISQSDVLGHRSSSPSARRLHRSRASSDPFSTPRMSPSSSRKSQQRRESWDSTISVKLHRSSSHPCSPSSSKSNSHASKPNPIMSRSRSSRHGLRRNLFLHEDEDFVL